MRNEARRAERRQARAPSTVRGKGVKPIDVTVEDISRTGIRFSGAGTFKVGDIITIGLSGVGTTTATVAWEHDGAFGCAFAQPIPEDALAKAFTARTVVRWAASPGPAGDEARAQARAAVEEIYHRHSMWSVPADVAIICGVAIALLAAAAWHFL